MPYTPAWQEPITGLGVVGFATDWLRPPRHQASTPFFYLATGQWRYDRLSGDQLVSPLAADGSSAARHAADANALGARLGWLPSYPTFDRNPIEIVRAAELGDMLGPVQARELLGEFRAAIELAAAGLREQTSPYHHLFDALIALLGPATDEDLDHVLRLAARGPPSEEVGLAPFGPGPSASGLGQPQPGPRSSGVPPELMPAAGAMP